MSEHVQSNWLVSAIVILCVVFFGSIALVWSAGDRLSVHQQSGEAKVAVPPAPSQADATAGLEKRVLSLEAKANTPPPFDASQLEAQLKDLRSQIAAVQTQLGSFKGADFNALETKLEAKIGKTGTTSSESVQTAVDALQTDIRNMNTRFDQLAQQVDLKRSSRKSGHSRSR